jgi:DNA-binding NarL/FixJ family response regulator
MNKELTEQERLVFAEIAKGGKNREIAQRIEASSGLRISENHISVVLYHIGKKLGLRDRASIALHASQSGGN